MSRLLMQYIIALVLAVSAEAQAQGYVDHPRLLFSVDEIPALRDKIKGNSTSAVTFRDVRTQANDNLTLAPDTLLAGLEGLGTISELALVHLLEGPLLSIRAVGTSATPSADGRMLTFTLPADYGAKAREVTLHLAQTRDVDNDDFQSSLRLRSLALGYDMAFAEATAGERQEVQDEILSYLTYMPPRYEYYRYAENPHTSNRGMMVGAAMGLGVLALWDDVSPAQQATLVPLLDFAHALVVKCLTDILANDGSYREGVLYAGWMLRHAIPYLEARRRFDGLDLANDTRLQRVAEWLCYEVLPEGGGRTNNLNDSLWRTCPLAVHSTYLDWAQTRYGSSLAAYLYEHVVGQYGVGHGSDTDKVATVLWNQDMPVVDPGTVLENGRLFVERGIYFYRSGWKNAATGNEILLSFQSSNFRGGHAQEDQNNFTLYAYGDRYVVDHGSPGESMQAKETTAHNVVLIDGMGQHNAGNSIGTDGSITEAFLSPLVDYVCGDAASAYATYSPLNAPDVPFPGSDWSWGYAGGNPVQHADRLLVSVKGAEAPPYFLVADDIRKDDAVHEYTWLLHTDSTNVLDHSANPVVITGEQSSLQVVFVNPQVSNGLRLGSSPFSHGGKDPGSTVLRARCTAVEPAFFVALLPIAAGSAPPAITAGPHGTNNASELTLDWGTVRDDAVFNPDRTMLTGAIETNGRLAFVRSRDQVAQGYLLVDGNFLHFQGEAALLLGDTATAILSGETLYLSRQDVWFIAYGANVNQVLGPEGPIPFIEMDGEVRSELATDVREPSATPEPEPPTLDVNTPNPFNAGTEVRFTLPQAGSARVRVFDARGRLVRVLANADYSAGQARVFWDGTDAQGRRQASGAYIVQLESAGYETSRKIIVVR